MTQSIHNYCSILAYEEDGIIDGLLFVEVMRLDRFGEEDTDPLSIDLEAIYLLDFSSPWLEVPEHGMQSRRKGE